MIDKELGAWLRDNEALLYRMVWTKMRDMSIHDNPDDVETAVADSMGRAWQYRHTYHGGSIKAWMSSVVQTACVEVLRQHGYERKRQEHYIERLGARGTHTVPPHEQSYILREQIREGLSVMSSNSRRAVLMRFLGYDYHEIAYEMGVTFWQVRNYLSEGRAEARRWRQRKQLMKGLL